MTAGTTAGLTLDTGALLALDHPAKFLVMQARLDEALRRGGTLCIPVGVIAQAWRSPRQVRLARLLKSRDVDVAVMTPNTARAVGLVCARTGHDDRANKYKAQESDHLRSPPQDPLRLDGIVRFACGLR